MPVHVQPVPVTVSDPMVAAVEAELGDGTGEGVVAGGVDGEGLAVGPDPPSAGAHAPISMVMTTAPTITAIAGSWTLANVFKMGNLQGRREVPPLSCGFVDREASTQPSVPVPG